MTAKYVCSEFGKMCELYNNEDFEIVWKKSSSDRKSMIVFYSFDFLLCVHWDVENAVGVISLTTIICFLHIIYSISSEMLLMIYTLCKRIKCLLFVNKLELTLFLLKIHADNNIFGGIIFHK